MDIDNNIETKNFVLKLKFDCGMDESFYDCYDKADNEFCGEIELRLVNNCETLEELDDEILTGLRFI